MKAGTSRWVIILYWVAVIAGCIASEYNWRNTDLFVKPLLIPLLLLWVFLDIAPGHRPFAIIAGLLFSWLGDILLMFDKEYPVCFIFGLAFFLITHILYTLYFLRQKKSTWKISEAFWLIPVFGYAVVLVTYLYPNLGELKVPVLLYALVISFMLFSTLLFPDISGVKTFLVAGAVWFVTSDSLLAVNKFALAMPFASTFIRLSYALAQFLIVAAIIRYRNKSSAVNLNI